MRSVHPVSEGSGPNRHTNGTVAPGEGVTNLF